MNLSTTPRADATAPNNPVDAIIACDVSKDQINLIARFGKFFIERVIDNQPEIIEKELFADFGLKIILSLVIRARRGMILPCAATPFIQNHTHQMGNEP
jgi:hypothetical protein